MKTPNGVWIRIAGNAKNIRENMGDHWRVFVNRAGPEVPVMRWEVSGACDGRNMFPGTDPTGKNTLGLNAWIDCFGDLVVDKGVAHIFLHPAP